MVLTRNASLVQQSIFNKALKDKFLLVLNLPKCLKDLQVNNAKENGFVNIDRLQFSVFSAPSPAISIDAIPLSQQGQIYNITSQKRNAYTPMSVNFTVDNQYGNYYVLWKWLSFINDPKNSGMNEYFKKTTINPEIRFDRYLDYQSEINVYALDEYHKKIGKWVYTNCFPTYLGEISYNYRLPEEAECSFNFVYSQLDFKLVSDEAQP
jgi:hypothetical protein